MFKILKKQELATGIKLFEISAPEIAAKGQPGQFVIVRMDALSERIPLTIADFDRNRDTLTLIFQEVGRSTIDLGTMNEGDVILDIVGPLGKASEIEKFGKIICIGGGVGIAPIYPITRALKQAGNTIYSIIGARSREHLILEKEMQAISDYFYVVSDDGSAGEKGFVTDVLQRLMDEVKDVALVMAIGPLPMMKAASEMTRPYGIKTIVSLNPIMVDGTGMCGACRVAVGGNTMFACVDGPEFDGHQVDWSIAELRSRMFVNEEIIAMNKCCSGGEGQCQKQK